MRSDPVRFGGWCDRQVAAKGWIIDPILAGFDGRDIRPRDLEFTHNLDLLALNPPTCVANPIQTKVISQELT